MKRWLILLLLLQVLPGASQKFDLSVCDQYFAITNRLRQGDSLDRATWTRFLQDSAIIAYMDDQGVDDAYFEAYRKNMQIVYMPQKDSVLRKRLTEPYQYWLTYLINQHKVHEAGMKEYLQKIRSDPEAFLSVSYEYAYGALPAAAHKRARDLTISIIPIHNDAHAQDNWIIYTLICAYFNDKNRLGALGGHEFHHILRPRQELKLNPGDVGLVQALERVLNEGSADLVDKKFMSDTARSLLESQRYFSEFYNEAVKVLPRMDSLIRAASAGRQEIKVSEFFRGTPYSSGHVPGTYMAWFIDQNGLKKDLIRHLDDPFYFFIVYDRAARKDKTKPFLFSDQSLKHIRKLRSEYITGAKRKAR